MLTKKESPNAKTLECIQKNNIHEYHTRFPMATPYTTLLLCCDSHRSLETNQSVIPPIIYIVVIVMP